MIDKLLPIALIVAAVGIFFGYTNKEVNGPIKEMQEKVASYDKALLASEAFAKKEADLISQRDAIPVESLDRFKVFLPDSVNNVKLILDLNELAKSSGVTITNFVVKDAAISSTPQNNSQSSLSLESTEPIDSLDISIAATGTYDSFRVFLGAAEKSLRLLDVVDIGVRNSTTGVYTYEITFRLYWLR
jgi:Tfp pilus assembly protein PilO